jgi:antitoxin (DNA-binding transcriptional repressor) of toxin-antitoxin stability system
VLAESSSAEALDVATKRWYYGYMVQVGLKEAKNRLSQLVTMALLGETVVIRRQGASQSVQLTPIPPPPHPTSGFGMLQAQLADLPPDWNSAEAETDFLQQFEVLDE